MKKFEFTGETKKFNLGDRTIVLQRIRAVAEFGLIKAGDLGGWIEKEESLSQEGEAWVCDNAEVWGNAKVCGNAVVYENAKVYGNAEVCGNAVVCDNAKVYGSAKVWDNAVVYGSAKVCDSAEVYGSANVWGNAKVYGNAKVWDYAKVYGNAEVWDNAVVYGNAKVCGNAKVWDNANVWDYAEVFSPNHVMTIGAIGSRNDFTTFYRGKDKQIMVKCGCFNDTIDKFVEKVKQTHGNNQYARVYRAAAEVARIQIDLEGKPQESEE